MIRLLTRRLALAVLGALFCLPAAGCGPGVEGYEHGERIERRAGDGGRLGSADLAAATDDMVSKIANVPAIRRHDGRTVIVMDRITNETNDPSEDFQVFLARIRALLNQSGAAEDLMFVETRTKAEQILRREGYPRDATARTLPEYALTGTFYELRRGSGTYYLLTFQLMDLTDATLAWEGSYEVKL